MNIRFPLSGVIFDLGSPSPESYASELPVLRFQDYFVGSLSAQGIFVGLSGRVERRFTLSIEGHWSKDHGTLKENFHYCNGETGERVWEMNLSSDRNFSATASDVVGEARGQQCGNAAMMRYRLVVPRTGKKDIIVGIEDWFYLLDGDILINRARMTKFGIKVGEIFASFNRDKSQ